jgi:bleomycin hydrolase
MAKDTKEKKLTVAGYKGISSENLSNFSKDFNKDRANLIAANAAVKSGVLEAAADYGRIGELPMSFSIDLKQGKITNQKASGRCWLFCWTARRVPRRCRASTWWW